jgi:hypothetical protein
VSKDILSRALEEVLDESYDEMTGQDIPDYEFSAGFKEKMESLMSPESEAPEKKKRRPLIMMMTAAAAAAAVLCVWAGMRETPKLEPKTPPEGNIISETPTTTVTGTADIAETTWIAEGTTVQAGSVTGTVQTTAITPRTGRPGLLTTAAADTGRTQGHGGTVHTTTAKAGGSGEAAAVTTTQTALKPASPQQTTVTTIDIGLQQQVDEYERSINMKKFFAAAAATAMLPSILPTNALAVYQPPVETDTALVEYFSAMDSGAIRTDYDGNGLFERDDLYYIYAGIDADYEVTSEVKAAVKANADVNGDGVLDNKDYKIFCKYYLNKHGFDPEDYKYVNYPRNKNGELTLTTFYAADGLRECADEYDLFYQVRAEELSSGETDLDLNCDGKVDNFDIFTYYLYYNHFGSTPYPYNSRDLITAEQGAKCAALTDNYKYIYNIDELLTKYFLYNCGFEGSWLNAKAYTDYLIDIEEKAGVEENAENRRVIVSCFNYILKTEAIEAGLAEVRDQSAKIDQYQSPDFDPNFWIYFDKYCDDMEKGIVPPVDVNRDGVIDPDDANIMLAYMSDIIWLINPEESSLDYDQWVYIDTQIDLNNDGVCGDIYDIMIVDMLEQKYSYDQLTDMLTEYNKAQEERETVAKIESIKYLESISGESIKRTGDADCNNEVKMNDVVLILQSYSAPDTYKLTEWGKFNADVKNTGDGVTPADALRVQETLLGIER